MSSSSSSRAGAQPAASPAGSPGGASQVTPPAGGTQGVTVMPGSSSASSPSAGASPPLTPAQLGALLVTRVVASSYAARPALDLNHLGDEGGLSLEARIASMLPNTALYEGQVQSCFESWDQSAVAFRAAKVSMAQLEQQMLTLGASLKLLRQDFIGRGQAFTASVQVAAAGNAQIITSAGIPVAAGKVKASAAPKVLVAPAQVMLTPGRLSGEEWLTFGKVKGASGYVAQRSFEPVTATSWVAVEGKITRHMLMKGLPPTQRVSFRVAAVTASDQGPWSQVVAITVS
jgi:hypothetical protein